MIQLLQTLSGHRSGIYNLKVWQEKIYSASGDGFIIEWDLDTGIGKVMADVKKAIYTFYIDANYIWIGTQQGNIHVIDRNTQQEIKNLLLTQSSIYCIHHWIEKDIVYFTDANGGIGFIDTQNYQLVHYEKIASTKLRKIAHDTHYLYTTDAYNAVVKREYPTLQIVQKYASHTQAINVVEIDTDRNTILSGGKDAYLKIQTVNDGEIIADFPAHNYAIYAIAVSPNQQYIASCSMDKTCKIWDYVTMDIIQRIDKSNQGHTHSVNTLLWYNDTTLITAGDDRNIKVWRVK